MTAPNYRAIHSKAFRVWRRETCARQASVVYREWLEFKGFGLRLMQRADWDPAAYTTETVDASVPRAAQTHEKYERLIAQARGHCTKVS